MSLQADLVLREGELITMDEARPRARAVAVRNGKIVAVGDDGDVTPFIGKDTRVVNLAGRAVLPALTDAHAHLVGLGMELVQVDLRGCDSPAACAERVRKGAGEGEWIQGRGWDQNRFADPRFPTHAALDAVEARRPVWLRRVDGHAGWANGAALARAGVTRATEDPPGGRVLRDARGEPTGVLVDTAMDLVERAVPATDAAAIERAILRGQEVVLASGLTAVHEMGIGPQTQAVYRALAASGRLAVRVYAFAAADEAGLGALNRQPEPSPPMAMFTLRGIKLYADGALGSRGAALLSPYSDDPQNSGLVITQADAIEAAARRALASGWQLAVHAIGDRANRLVLDAFERAGCMAHPDHRFRIEHAQVVDPTDIKRFQQLGVIASMQPTHATSDMPWAEARLGRARLAGAYAWRRFLDAGVHIAGGSDFPVEDVDPIGGGLYAAVTRSDHKGQPPGGWLPDQKLTLEEAVRAFSVDAAAAAFQEGWRGRIKVGQAADLTVLDRELGGSPGRALASARADLTIVAGAVRYDRAHSSHPRE
jgi:predicted amidohydrolase YtcJ